MTHTQQPPTRLSLAWLLAAKDLQFDFISPYVFVDGDGHSHSCSGLVVHFGSPQGTLIVSQHDEDPDADIIGSTLGYYTSALNPLHYETYVRSNFIETLVDWGWYGPADKRPGWFPK
jgi:hypothetical protein